MTRRSNRGATDRSRAPGYALTAGRFFDGAESAMDLGNWDAAGLLYVHAAIAFADAVAIRRKGEKSAGENHLDAVALFAEAAAGVDGREEAIKHLRRLIEEKTRVSYIGTALRKAEAEELRKHADRFRTFCSRLLQA